MPKAIFTSGLRTPFGRSFKGAYRDVRADDLLVEVDGLDRFFDVAWNEHVAC